MAKERKKIAAFLEDYEDERDDEKYYRGELRLQGSVDRNYNFCFYFCFLVI